MINHNKTLITYSERYRQLLDINTTITILCDERYLQVNSDIVVIIIFI